MKIIKPGIVPESVEVWPIGYKFTCDLCTCVFVIEQEDGVEGYTEKLPNGKSWIVIACPTCENKRKFNSVANNSVANKSI